MTPSREDRPGGPEGTTPKTNEEMVQAINAKMASILANLAAIMVLMPRLVEAMGKQEDAAP